MRRAVRLAACVVALLGLTLSPAMAAPRLVDSLVAVVGEEPLLRSDVEREIVLLRAEVDGTDLSSPASDTERTRALEALVDRVVVMQEARRLALFAPRAEEVGAERARWLEGSPFLPDVWRGRGWSEASLDDSLAQRLQASRYIDSRARFGAGRTTLPRRSDEPPASRETSSNVVVTELRRRARVVVIGIAGGRGGVRTSGRVTAATATAAGSTR
jgi:hypothetical protein